MISLCVSIEHELISHKALEGLDVTLRQSLYVSLSLPSKLRWVINTYTTNSPTITMADVLPSNRRTRFVRFVSGFVWSVNLLNLYKFGSFDVYGVDFLVEFWYFSWEIFISEVWNMFCLKLMCSRFWMFVFVKFFAGFIDGWKNVIIWVLWLNLASYVDSM